ncbi:hypothetical protein, partial [Salinactinospora qingdaonensis]|uniref:hypothetical protein n=1 Tax=Salinactinospora qingdaonensis TaxID=702744 RepID=UPI0031E6BA74
MQRLGAAGGYRDVALLGTARSLMGILWPVADMAKGAHDRCVTKNLDALLTALYVHLDDHV